MKRITCLTSMLLIIFNLSAQDKDRIETDRPNETDIPSIVPRKFFQVETGVYAERTSASFDLISHPAALFKYGLSNHVELRLYTKLSTAVEHLSSKDITSTGIEPVELGLKVSMIEEKNWIPETSLILQTGLPTIASKSFKAAHLSPKFRILMENKITETISITYNFGTEWDGNDTEPEWLYTFTPGIDIGRKLHAFVETFSFFKRNESPEHTLDGGIEYFVRKNFTIDICSGFGLNKAAPRYFLTAGGSIRFR